MAKKRRMRGENDDTEEASGVRKKFKKNKFKKQMLMDQSFGSFLNVNYCFINKCINYMNKFDIVSYCYLNVKKKTVMYVCQSVSLVLK